MNNCVGVKMVPNLDACIRIGSGSVRTGVKMVPDLVLEIMARGGSGSVEGVVGGGKNLM